MRKTHKKLFFILIFAFFPTSVVFAADVSITEIMYDAPGTDTDHEWIEIHNNSSSSIDLSGWKFFEEGSNHGLTAFQGGTNLSAGSFAIIASNAGVFTSDFPSVSGMILDSSWSSFSNTGETLALKDASGVIVDEVTYTGGSLAVGDGNTLQEVSGSWVSGPPTPGAENAEGSSSGGGGEEEEVEATTTSGSSTEVQVLPKIRPPIADVSTSGLAIVGLPFTFKPTVRNEYGVKVVSGFFFWNFGDGTNYETDRALPVTHTYKYTGKYVVYFDWYDTWFDDEPFAFEKMTIEVIEPELVVAGVRSDGGIEIKNEGSKDRDLSGWILNVNDRFVAVLPKRTTVLANSTLVINPDVTGMRTAPKTVELRLPDNIQKVAFYSSSQTPFTYAVAPQKQASKQTILESKVSSNEIAEIATNTEPKTASPEEPTVLGASILVAEESAGVAKPISVSVSAEKVSKNSSESENKSWMYTLGFVILGVGIVVALKKIMNAGKESRPSDDYTILSS